MDSTDKIALDVASNEGMPEPEVGNPELDAKVLELLGGDKDKFAKLTEPEYQAIVDQLPKAETVRNPRSDAEGAHEELNPRQAAPPSAAPAPIVKAVPHEGTGDSRDTAALDSIGNPKGDPKEEKPEPLHGTGPRGEGAPNETLDEKEKRLRAELAEIRSQRGMSNTDQVDSIGNRQHIFEQEVQGHDKHGNRIPDKSTGVIVEEAPQHIGPRGAGVPLDTWHGKRK